MLWLVNFGSRQYAFQMRPWAPCPMGAINSYPEALAGQALLSISISFEFALKVVFAVDAGLISYS